MTIYKFAITSCYDTGGFSISFRKVKNIKEKDLMLIRAIQEIDAEPLFLSPELAAVLFLTPINTMDGYTELTENKVCPTFASPFRTYKVEKKISNVHGMAEWILRNFDDCISDKFKEEYKNKVEELLGRPYQEIAEEAYAMFIKSRQDEE